MTGRKIPSPPGNADAGPVCEPVPVRDLAALLVAKSLLEGADIPFFVSNESKHITSPYPVSRVVIMVAKTRADEARRLLEPLKP